MEFPQTSDADAPSIAIVVPCLNEELSLEALARAIRDEFDRAPYWVTVVLVDDGSSDGTWDKIDSIAANSGRLQFVGMRLQRNRGKSVAQAVGLRGSLTHDFVVFMDADGQHSVASIPELIECSRLSALPCIARRSKYERRLTSVVGTAALTVASWIVGSRFDPRDGEFVAVPAEQCREMVKNPQLGVTPLLPIVYETGDVTHLDVEVLPGFDDNRNSRWSLSSLWHKGLMQLLSDPWVALPRLAALVGVVILLVAVYGIVIGVQSVLAGTFLGIGSVIVIQSVTLAVIGILLVMILGFVVIFFVVPFNGSRRISLLRLRPVSDSAILTVNLRMKTEKIIDDYYDRHYHRIHAEGCLGLAGRQMHNLLEDQRADRDFPVTVELGCGDFEHYRFVKHRCDDYIATDIRRPRVAVPDQAIWNQGHGNVTFIQTDAMALPFPAEFADRIVAGCLLLHLPNIREAIIEWQRISKPTGVIDLLVPCDPGLASRAFRRVISERSAQSLGVPRDTYRLVNSLEHINSFRRALVLTKSALMPDRRLKVRYFPFAGVPSWNLNAFAVFSLEPAVGAKT